MRQIFRTLSLLCLLLAGIVIPAGAVTQKEMEQARTITAFWYLRYANNGAGYMEEKGAPATMAELEKMLKETEKKNLQAFKAVSTPSDYAGWDKKKLEAYWGETFFNSPGLSAQGKVARSRVKSKLAAMTVAAPAAEPATEAKPAATEAPAPAAETKPAEPADTKGQPSVEADAPGLPAASDIVEQAVALDSTALQVEENAREEAASRKSGSGSTWIYIVALIILVGVVVWLVIFASKTMQDSNKPKVGTEEAPTPKLPESHQQVAPVSPLSPEAIAETRALRREIKSLQEECSRLGEENSRLQVALAEAQKALAVRAQIKAEPVVEQMEVRKPPQAPVAAPQPSPAVAVAPAPAAPVEAENSVREIYLGRVNPKGLFVRADRRPVPDKSVFVLSTEDGYTGTFRILQIAEVIERCLDNPDHYLAGGCSAPDLLATEDAGRIRTLQAGTAVFEDGCWRMVRKTKIAYE